MATSLQNYFEARLKEMGWNAELDVRYSLSSCQGDGVSFIGGVDCENLLALRYQEFDSGQLVGAARVKNLREKCRQKLLLELALDYTEVDVSLKEIDHRYVHENTVRAENPDFISDHIVHALEDQPELADAAIKDCLQWSVEDWGEWHTEWVDFVKEEHDRACNRLEREGYKMIFASPLHDDEEEVWSFSTRRFKVVVKKTESLFLDNCDFIDFDDDDITGMMKGVVDGEDIHFDLNTQVFELDDDGEEEECLVDDRMDFMIISKDDDNHRLGGLRQEVVRNALVEVRYILKERAEKAVAA